MGTSLDKPAVTTLDLPRGPFHFSIPVSLQTAHSLPGHTHRGDGQHVALRKLRNPQVGSEEGGFF